MSQHIAWAARSATQQSYIHWMSIFYYGTLLHMHFICQSLHLICKKLIITVYHSTYTVFDFLLNDQ